MTPQERAAHLKSVLEHPGFAVLETTARDRAFNAFVSSDDPTEHASAVAEYRAVQALRRTAENFVASISRNG